MLSMMVMYRLILAWLSFSLPGCMSALEKPGIIDITCGGQAGGKDGSIGRQGGGLSRGQERGVGTEQEAADRWGWQGRGEGSGPGATRRMHGLGRRLAAAQTHTTHTHTHTCPMGPIFMMLANCSYIILQGGAGRA